MSNILIHYGGCMPTVRPIYEDENGNIDRRRSFLSLGIHRRLGHPNEYGFNDLGKSEFGEANPLGGTYRRGYTGYNSHGYNPERPKKRIYIQMRDTTPNNPRTDAQQANRGKFAAAMAAWAGLTPLEQGVWNTKAAKKGRRGYNQFVQWYMRQPE